MDVPQMLGDGGRLQIYSLVIADDAMQGVGNWQMLGEGMLERGRGGEGRQRPVKKRKGSGITAPGRRINQSGVRWGDSGCSVRRGWGSGNGNVFTERHSVTPFQF